MYQRVLNALQDFFGISRKEARGALAMMVCCVVIVWTPFLFRRWILPQIPVDTPPPERKVLDSIALLLEKQQANKGWSRRQYAPKEPAAFNPDQIKRVNFDPNAASVRELTEVGIPAFIARRIEKFRGKGGRFRQKEDLKKIYDFPPDLYVRLEKYIVIPDQKQAFAAGQNNSSRTYPNAAARREVRQGIQAFDINQCDTTALIRLKGIGSKLATRILKFRDGLGGFHSPDQFQEVYGLDSLALSELKRYAKVLSGVRKISINVAAIEELGRHPYLRNRKQVQVLIRYRTEHGPFRSLDELRNVKVLDDATIQKIGPYLSF
ncbi:MAG: DNA uptake-like protein [Dyadobacter sp. 50-39]|uniref:ComEA family DNA-binding protein n=1 Tax=Dyadobacter sp. 50-39 TaxID=1895756 RepID=UPI0009612340|nr:helix-hairpin-helix domain-containing protein [Dyadobacter sp. 50-39]OJV16719.1 MAG: DNA uptake-like protein [Dyadobacter sp. 50-39]